MSSPPSSLSKQDASLQETCQAVSEAADVATAQAAPHAEQLATHLQQALACVHRLQDLVPAQTPVQQPYSHSTLGLLNRLTAHALGDARGYCRTLHDKEQP